MTGLVTAIYDIGCAVGAVCAFIFGERLGRKRSIIVAQVIGTVKLSGVEIYGFR
jgi:MFS family permease